MSATNPNSFEKNSNEGNQENIESSTPTVPPSAEQQTNVKTTTSLSTPSLPSSAVSQNASIPASPVTPALPPAPSKKLYLEPPSIEQSTLRTSTSDEESELNSNLQSNNRNSIINTKTNVKTNSKTNVSLNLKSNQPKGFRFRVEDLKLNKNIKSKSIKLNRIKQNLKSVKNTNLKRNRTLNIKQQSIIPKAQKRNVSDLVDMMFQLNVNNTSPVSHSIANSNDSNRRQNRNRTFTFQSNIPYNQFSPRISSPRISSRLSDNQQTTGLSLGNRNELVDLRLLYIFEKLINLIDRFINLINELRINYIDQNNDILVNRIISDENNADLLDTISSILPDRLANRISERFSVILAQELEKVFNKYFSDRKNK